MDNKTLAKIAVKAGLIMAGVFVIIGLLDIIPSIKCIINIINVLLFFVPGFLACYICEKEVKVPSVGEGAFLGVIAGPVSTISCIVVIPVGVLFGGANIAGMLHEMGSEAASITATFGDLVSIFVGIPIYIIIVGLVLAIVNAGVGVIYAVIKI